MLEVLLVRHGVTVMNETGRWQGWEDTPLSPAGLDQARRVAQALARDWAPVQALYCSPLRRAAETAQVVCEALGVSAVPIEGLRDCDLGDAAGLTFSEIAAKYPGILSESAGANGAPFRWPGGETRDAYFARTVEAFQEIIRGARRGRVAVVAHAGSVRAALKSLFPDRFSRWWEIPIANCAISAVRLDAGTPMLLALNRGEHLARTPDPGDAGACRPGGM